MPTCIICGVLVPKEDMSKSYKRRCKNCVASLEKSKRLSNVHTNKCTVDTVGIKPIADKAEFDYTQFKLDLISNMLGHILADNIRRCNNVVIMRTNVASVCKIADDVVAELESNNYIK